MTDWRLDGHVHSWIFLLFNPGHTGNTPCSWCGLTQRQFTDLVKQHDQR